MNKLSHTLFQNHLRSFCLAALPLLFTFNTAYAQSGTASADLRGAKVWYQTETVITSEPVYNMSLSAGAGTIIFYDSEGAPNFIAFAQPPNGLVQGEYGIDGTGPKNKGRLIYRQINPNIAMAYTVFTRNDIYIYHLKYLELTTAGNDTEGYNTYATKAIAFDNKVFSASKQLNITCKLIEGGQLVISNGKIRFGDNYVSPNYTLSGKIP